MEDDAMAVSSLVETLSETQRKLLDKLVSQDREIRELKKQLTEEKEAKLEVQNNYEGFKNMGLLMGKGLTEIIEDLISGLVLREEGGEDEGRDNGEDDGDEDMRILRRRIPMALNILKEKIMRVDFDTGDKKMLEDLRKMINIFLGKKSKPEEVEYPVGDGDDLLDQHVESMEFSEVEQAAVKSEREDFCEDSDSILDLNVDPLTPQDPPIQVPLHPVVVVEEEEADLDLDPNSDADSDIVFIEEIPVEKRSAPSTSSTPADTQSQLETQPSDNGDEPFEVKEEEDDEVTPRIVATYSCVDIPTPSSSSMPQQAKRRLRQVAMKRTGGFTPKIAKHEEDQEVNVRKSPRSLKPTSKVNQAMKDSLKKKKLTHAHAIHPDNPGQCLCGFRSSEANVECHVRFLTGCQGQGRQLDKGSSQKIATSGKPKTERGGASSKIPKLKKRRTSTPSTPTVEATDKKDDRNRDQHIFKCLFCTVSYPYYSWLTNHLKLTHKIVRKRKGPVYGCSSCGKIYLSNKKLFRHRMSAHSDDKCGDARSAVMDD